MPDDEFKTRQLAVFYCRHCLQATATANSKYRDYTETVWHGINEITA